MIPSFQHKSLPAVEEVDTIERREYEAKRALNRLRSCSPIANHKNETRWYGERKQPGLVTLQLHCWAAYLRGQADALGLLIIDTGETPVREAAETIASVAARISANELRSVIPLF